MRTTIEFTSFFLRKKLGDCILLCERHIDCPKNLRHTKNYVSITYGKTHKQIVLFVVVTPLRERGFITLEPLRTKQKIVKGKRTEKSEKKI